MIGSIARGTTRVKGLLDSEDVMRTRQALQACGAQIAFKEGGEWVIEGVGLEGLKAPKSDIYLGNSGTSIRLLTGLFAGQQFSTVLTGDPSLSMRPMRRIVDPLSRMGANITLSEEGTPPVRIDPAKSLNSINWCQQIASAQVKSAILLAALYAQATTHITEQVPTRDYTESMLNQFGASVQHCGTDISISGRPELKGQAIDVPVDFSSAAFFIVAALLVPSSDLLLENVGINNTRTGLLQALKAMGALISIENQRRVAMEWVADLRIQHQKSLQGIKVPAELVPLMIDEIPILAIAAAFAKGRTVLTGCEELRVKESDRIASVANGLAALGIAVEEQPDGMSIEGGRLGSGRVNSFGDHRIAMAFAVAGAVAGRDVEIDNCDCVNTSFPGFVDVARSCGINIEAVTEKNHAG